MFGYIYITTNLVNNKKYIGKKKSNIFLGEAYLGSGVRLTSAIKKYGKENFRVDLLEECASLPELNDREKYWISFYQAVELETYYNIASGGDGGILWEKGHHPSLGRRMIGKKNPFFGKHHTEEEIQKQKNSFLKTLENGYVPPVKNKHQVRKNGVIRYVSLEDAYILIADGWKCSYIEKVEKDMSKEKGTITKWNQSDFQKRRASETHKGKIISEEQKEKFRNTIKNKSKEEKEEWSKHCKESQEKLRWVVKQGEVPLRVHEEEVESFLKKGYIRGRKFK